MFSAIYMDPVTPLITIGSGAHRVESDLLSDTSFGEESNYNQLHKFKHVVNLPNSILVKLPYVVNIKSFAYSKTSDPQDRSVSRTPKKPEYLVARSQLTLLSGPLGFGPIQFFMDSYDSYFISLVLQIPCEARCLGTQNPIQNHLQKGF